MIPVYNPDPKHLAETLCSILQQDRGPQEMQIEVVDDASPHGDAKTVVRDVTGGRVVYSREPMNRGLAGIWNRCIERACGEWVHILHQDDLVYPGFYDKLRAGLEGCDYRVGAAFTRFAISNAEGQWTLISAVQSHKACVLENWREQVSVTQPLQCAATVVRKSVYEQIGGFSPEFRYSLDWEMWQRIAASYNWWHEPDILACWRTHSGSASTKLAQGNSDVEDVLRMLGKTKSYHPSENASRWHGRARAYWGTVVIQTSRSLLSRGLWRKAWLRALYGLRISKNYEVLDEFLLFLTLFARLSAAKLKSILK